MIDLPITDDTFLVIAMNHYDNPQCTSLEEFEEDLKRFGYLKRLFGRYTDNNDLKERLILNHLIVLYNLFGVTTTEMLFFKIDRHHWDLLSTFLVFLDKMPGKIPEFSVVLDDLQLDSKVLSVLRGL